MRFLPGLSGSGSTTSFWLLPVYAAASATAAILTGSGGWRDATLSPWAIVTTVLPTVALVHLFGWFCEMCLADRRATAVLSRSLRHGRHVWATASGERVRIYSIAPRRSFVPHLWPVTVGRRGDVNGGREFSVEDEAEAAFQYATELERASRVHPEAVALASVINERSPGSA